MLCQYCNKKTSSCRFGKLRAKHYSHNNRCIEKKKFVLKEQIIKTKNTLIGYY